MITTVFASLLCIATADISQERLPMDVVPVMSVDLIDYAAMLEQDAQRDVLGLPYRFAEPKLTSVSPATHGIWERLPNNKMRWSYRVVCDNSRSIKIGLSR